VFVPLSKIALDSESNEKKRLSCFDFDKSSVSITVARKDSIVSLDEAIDNVSNILHYYRGATLLFQFTLLFDENILEDDSIIFFSPLMQNKEKKKERLKKQFFRRILNGILTIFQHKKHENNSLFPSFSSKNILKDINFKIYKKKTVINASDGDIQTKQDPTPNESPCQSDHSSMSSSPMFHSAPFLALQPDCNSKTLKFELNMDSSFFAPSTRLRPYMWLSVEQANGTLKEILPLCIPKECLKGMIFLLSYLDYPDVGYKTSGRNTISVDAKFMRSDGKPVKVEPDFIPKEFEGVSVRKDNHSAYKIEFDRRKIRKSAGNDKSYYYLKFKDSLSDGKLFTTLPISSKNLAL
jgi:hypothetical protein